MEELNLERGHLLTTVKSYNEVLVSLNTKFENVPKNFGDNPRLLYEMSKLYGLKIDLVSKNIDKPYFARIDFKSDNDIEKCYISKVGLYDDDYKIITVDWRTPIANIYYDSNIGDTSYEAPEGIISGELLLKRQFEIESGKLISYQDVDTVSNDDILKPYLSASADNRLKNIVTTIQSEQNKIIREKLYKNIIVQGVAGSGKTTVALHRIAYLVYNHIDSIKPDAYMVLGPNKFFVNYISSVLPDLDVNNVSQLTYVELITNYIKEKFKICDDDHGNIEFDKYKLSIKHKNDLKLFMNKYINNLIGDRDFIVKGYIILTYQEIEEIYNDSKAYTILDSRISRTVLLLNKYIKNNRSEILNRIETQFCSKINNLEVDDLRKEKLIYNNILKEFNSFFNSSLKLYFNKLIPKIFALYNNFIISDMVSCNKELFLKQSSSILKKVVSYADLATITYLNYRVYGSSDFDKYRQIVIDEAQDYSCFDFYIIKKIMKNASFSIFGDLAQSIYSYRSIDNWDEVDEIMFNKTSLIMYLLKSYRTTIEIMSEANKVIKSIGLNESLPVIRHGDEVIYELINNKINQIIDFVNLCLNRHFKTIAIISKYQSDSDFIYHELIKNGIDLVNINNSNTFYEGGVCTIISSLAKGLEFDSVIISDASSLIFDCSDILDMKMLYVSMTRPLHLLKILYNNELCNVLKG